MDECELKSRSEVRVWDDEEDRDSSRRPEDRDPLLIYD